MKAFTLKFLRHLLHRVLLDHLLRVLGDFGDKVAPIRPIAGSVVERASNHRLPTDETTLEDDDDVVLLEKLHHYLLDFSPYLHLLKTSLPSKLTPLILPLVQVEIGCHGFGITRTLFRAFSRFNLRANNDKLGLYRYRH